MTSPRKIELLAPARNADIGIEAIKHGADAVYIGANKFSARAAAGNSVEDIERLTQFAHVFGAKVYVTLNTILYDSELDEVKKLVNSLYNIGVDALIVQDAALLQMGIPPIPLHASTQMNNRTSEKVRRLKEVGFEQVVLARELSVDDIRKIHEDCDVRLEIFVHGALCVSYSGQCYASQCCFKRSANRGECAQFCRFPFDLIDGEGNEIIHHKYLLSLRDMNRSEHLEELLDAGVSSFKIEGRLKDMDYVKNVTAYYRKRLDEIFSRRKEFVRLSAGETKLTFQPQPNKSFNRGFTDYFLHQRSPNITSMNTPKSVGEFVGEVKEFQGSSFTVSGFAEFHNGDGLCFFDEKGDLHGFRVNRAELNRLFPHEMPKELKKRTQLYRNYDFAFEQTLSKPSAVRNLAVDIDLDETESGFRLTLKDEFNRATSLDFEYKKETARTSQIENQQKQLSRLGDTPFVAQKIKINLSDNLFIPSSVLAEWRRNLVEKHLQTVRKVQREKPSEHKSVKIGAEHLSFSANIANAGALDFYKKCGVKDAEPAYELEPKPDVAIMTCRHCIRYSLGLCKLDSHRTPPHEPYFLRLDDGRKFRLDFDCELCEMKIYAQN